MDRDRYLESAGRAVIEFVRDHTIHQLDQLLDMKMKTPSDQLIQQELQTVSPDARNLIRKVGRRVIDETLHNVMWMLEGGERLELWLKPASGERINLTELSDGLAGDVCQWTQAFSKYPPSIAT